MNKLTLIIVDCQHDFLEAGSLEVKGGLKAVASIRKLLMSGRVGHVIFTQDWHPKDHCSFAEQGGPWPSHCVRGTHGANIHPDLLQAVRRMNIYTEFLHKGKDRDREEYTAFEHLHDYDEFHAYHAASARTKKPEVMAFGKKEHVVVCGIAGDVCVLNTLKSLQPMRPEVFIEGTASLDGGQALADYMKEMKLQPFTSASQH